MISCFFDHFHNYENIFDLFLIKCYLSLKFKFEWLWFYLNEVKSFFLHILLSRIFKNNLKLKHFSSRGLLSQYLENVSFFSLKCRVLFAIIWQPRDTPDTAFGTTSSWCRTLSWIRVSTRRGMTNRVLTRALFSSDEPGALPVPG